MRIIHLWDICNNSQYLTEKLMTLGHQSKVITRKEYSRKRLLNYYLKVIYHLLTFRADIIHINSWAKGTVLAKIFSPRSKIIMHYHGSDIRGKMVPGYVQIFADKICFSTRDILDGCFNGYLLPVLVPDYFSYKGGREKGVIIELVPRTMNIDHELMPFILSLGEFYRDKKRINITSSQLLSKTGMEALACGTKVITDTGEVVTDYPRTIMKDYMEVYNALCNI